MKKTLTRLLTLSLVLVMALGLTLPGYTAEDYDQVIAFVHTNDVHGYVDVYAYLPAVVSDLERQYGDDNVILLSAGDEWAGLNIATLSQGENIVPLMNAAGYQLMALGNNDQNFGREQVLNLAEACDFPVLAANWVSTADQSTVLPASATIDCNGVTVGLFGLAPSMPATDGYAFLDGSEVAAQQRDALRSAGCDLVVAVTHIGFGDNYEVSSDKLADTVTGLDLIIDGHSHTELPEGYLGKTGTLVAQTGEFGNNIGVTRLYLKDGAVVKADTTLISRDAYTAQYTPDAAVQAIIDTKNAELEALTSQVVGHTDVLLDGSRPAIRSAETNLGSLCADAVRWYTGADVALFPGVKVRASIEAGDITLGDLLNVMANGAELYCEELTGAQLKSILTLACQYLPEQDMRYQHVSGMKYTYSLNASGNAIESMTLSDGTPIADDQVYKVAFETAVDLLGLDPTVYTPVLEGQSECAQKVLAAYLQSDSFRLPSGQEGRAVQVAASAPAASAPAASAPAASAPAASAPAASAPAASADSPAASIDCYYTVVAGDSLWKIAQKHYGTGTKWGVIYKANQSALSDPGLIYIGQKLLLP